MTESTAFTTEWIFDRPANPDEHGVARFNEWVIVDGLVDKDFEFCMAKAPDSDSVCYARAGHEHPHICCNSHDRAWIKNGRKGVVMVSRSRPLKVLS